MLVWGFVGGLAGEAGTTIPFFPFALVYAAFYGLSEALMLGIRVPSSKWQVPSSWILSHTHAGQVLVWGACLGPGLISRNTYASMWLLPFLLGLMGSSKVGLTLGLLVGTCHGVARAAGVISNARRGGGRRHLEVMSSQVYWRVFDGLVLLFAAGVLASRLI
jgi:hypothetical protein